MDDSPNASLLLCKLSPNQPLQAIDTPKSKIVTLVISPDGTRCAATFEDKSIWIWDLSDLEHPRKIPGTKEKFGMQFSPDGKTLAESGPLGWIHIWNAETG